ncbi:MAG: hypothetical protein EOO20_01780 [Chryseobacterium sp.]|nr:MAG: hypothetical protein EOO20_01780 [Chryseobacterium sp.]
MLSHSEIIGRVLSQSNPEMARDIVSQFRRTLKDPALVSKIFCYIQNEFAEEESDIRRLIFIGAIYQLYQPLSFLRRKEDDKASGKLPIGVRDEMQKCLEFVNPEMVSHFKSYIEPAMKPDSNGVVRPMKVKVMRVVEAFKPFSINKEDTQYQLFS